MNTLTIPAIDTLESLNFEANDAGWTQETPNVAEQGFELFWAENWIAAQVAVSTDTGKVSVTADLRYDGRLEETITMDVNDEAQNRAFRQEIVRLIAGC